MHSDNICMYIVHVCFYVCCNDCVGVCGMFDVWRALLKYVVCFCRGRDGWCALCLNFEAWSCWYSCTGSGSLLSCIMLYVCVLCVSCGSPQCCVLHDFQFVHDRRGC